MNTSSQTKKELKLKHTTDNEYCSRLATVLRMVNADILSGGIEVVDGRIINAPGLRAVQNRPWMIGSDITDEEVLEVLNMSLSNINTTILNFSKSHYKDSSSKEAKGSLPKEAILATSTESIKTDLRWWCNIGDNIALLRKKRGLKLEQIAVSTNLTIKQVYGLEKGTHQLTKETLEKLAKVLHCATTDIDPDNRAI